VGSREEAAGAPELRAASRAAGTAGGQGAARSARPSLALRRPLRGLFPVTALHCGRTGTGQARRLAAAACGVDFLIRFYFFPPGAGFLLNPRSLSQFAWLQEVYEVCVFCSDCVSKLESNSVFLPRDAPNRLETGSYEAARRAMKWGGWHWREEPVSRSGDRCGASLPVKGRGSGGSSFVPGTRGRCCECVRAAVTRRGARRKTASPGDSTMALPEGLERVPGRRAGSLRSVGRLFCPQFLMYRLVNDANLPFVSRLLGSWLRKGSFFSAPGWLASPEQAACRQVLRVPGRVPARLYLNAQTSQPVHAPAQRRWRSSAQNSKYSWESVSGWQLHGDVRTPRGLWSSRGCLFSVIAALNKFSGREAAKRLQARACLQYSSSLSVTE